MVKGKGKGVIERIYNGGSCIFVVKFFCFVIIWLLMKRVIIFFGKVGLVVFRVV